jgi:hypothetical protein
MSELGDAIDRQGRSEGAAQEHDEGERASIHLSDELRTAIADFLARGVPPSGEFPMGRTTGRSRFFETEGVREPAWVLLYRSHDGAPGAPNLLLDVAGELHFSAGFEAPFLPLRRSDRHVRGYPSAGDLSTAGESTLIPGTPGFDEAVIEVLAGLVRTGGETSGPEV